MLKARQVEKDMGDGGITKAVLTAAGCGSRLLPFTRGLPKEMIPCCARTESNHLVLKPALEVIYESLYEYGCREFCFVVGRSRKMIEDYFLADDSAKYPSNRYLQDFFKKIRSSRITYVEQPSPRGFGDAVLKAKTFTGSDIFLLCAGDDMVLSQNSNHIRRLEDAFFSNDADLAFLIDTVARPEQYGVIDGEKIGQGLFRVEHLEEKPKSPKTNLAVVPVYIFKPSIFSELERTMPDENGEVQLSDAIGSIAACGKCVAVELEAGEKRQDLGTPKSYAAAIKDSFDNWCGSRHIENT